MQFQDNIPIYVQIEKYLYRQIALGQLKPGEKVPSVRQLAVELTVNVNTVQRALNQMNNEGILYVKRGLGSFVTEDVELISQKRQELVEEALSEFLKSTAQLGLTAKQTLTALKKYIEEEK
ncbi:DNA-binding transcriptional regulator YhcF (GntR family) [Lactobacillus colini]|uniref:DNA-binding transcriptional regulator YhcF (GntR family) n=1 Tax=Lactobacillus colini TaxID=1819254 RepID=A0ABS4MCE4_9LACO|nr:GntR family transcriptional regulator [Lactobacillus colini]MBP2057064.1 DNA-binding transcriptional regulator YhcF (GntR family) [Lactobacillus colini]